VRPILSPSSAPESIEDLAGEATLIVEGLVDSSNFPTRQPNPKISTHLESDVVFLVKKVIKDDLSSQTQFPRIIVSEYGGRPETYTLFPRSLSYNKASIAFSFSARIAGTIFLPSRDYPAMLSSVYGVAK